MVFTDSKLSPHVEYFKTIYPDLILNDEYKVVSSYRTFQEEYKTLTSGVGLRDISGRGLIELQGKDSLDFLHRISTNALSDLPVNSARTTIFTNEKGRIIDKTTVVNMRDFLFLLGSGVYSQKLYSWINKYVIMEDIKTLDVSDKYSVFEFYGPQAASFMIMLFGSIIEAIHESEIKTVENEGQNFFLLRTDEYDVRKYTLIGSTADCAKLLASIIEGNTVFDFNPVGEAAFQVFRTEKGIPAAPFEICDQYNPYETGLISYVNFTKGCYIGQEVIARLDAYDKVQRTLKGVIFRPEDSPEGIFTLYRDDTEAGKITSLVKSQALKKYAGLAAVRKSFSEDGTKLIARNEQDNEFEVTICSLPLKK